MYGRASKGLGFRVSGSSLWRGDVCEVLEEELEKLVALLGGNQGSRVQIFSGRCALCLGFECWIFENSEQMADLLWPRN